MQNLTDESVKKCHADMSYHRGLWINEGRPRGMQFVTFRLYKKAKDKFRRTLQNAYSMYETSFIILWMQLVMLTKRHYGVLFEIKEEVAILGPSKSPIK